MKAVAGWLALGLLTLVSWSALAGGGGVLTEDQCVVEMGFFKTHLTIYQPQTQASTKFCDAIPDLTDTVFVLDYLHDALNEVPIELRIIRDARGLGRYTRWSDIEDIDDLEPLTVFHQAPRRSAGGSFQVAHTFQQKGDYLLLVTTGHPTKDKSYHAVAPLQVGGGTWLYWLGLPAVAGAGLILFWVVRLRSRTDTSA